MARFFNRFFVILISLLLFCPLGSEASSPFIKKGFYLAHRHQAVLQRTSASSAMASGLSHNIQATSAPNTFVSLQQIELSQSARRDITDYIKKTLDESSKESSSTVGSSEQLSLGMGGVPVLNQGGWGSCVTFAVTAGLDAYYALNGSNQISQLCDLALGVSLKTSGSEGGWDGASAEDILSQIAQYGFLTMSYQASHGCGGLSSYPLYDDRHGSAMNRSHFLSAPSDRRFTDSLWRELGVLVRTDRELHERIAHPERGLEQLKASLRRGHRVSIGIVLDSDVGDVGAVGSYHGYKDVWMLTDAVSSAIDSDYLLGAHEVLITGFNDGCIKPTVSGKAQELCGYLTARNSWGSIAGNRGNYYIGYEYFNALANEAYEIG